MKRANAGGLPVWEIDGRVISGIGPDGFSFSLVTKAGERLAGWLVDDVAALVMAGQIEMPRRGRGLAYRR